MMDERNDKVEVIRLDIPGVANEWRRQRNEMGESLGEEWSNEMFAAYLLDIRQQAMQRLRVEKIVQEAGDPVDEMAKDTFGLDDVEPRGEVS